MAYPPPQKLSSRDIFPDDFGGEILQDEIEPPRKISKMEVESPVNLFNKNYRSGMNLWDSHLPKYDVSDSTETAQSQVEIVQKILALPCKDESKTVFEQGELLFVDKTAGKTPVRSNFTDTRMTPNTVKTLHKFSDITKAVGIDLETFQNDYNPLGFSFVYVDRLDPQYKYTSQMVSYTCGGLCDVLNVWNVNLAPGMNLFLVVQVDPDHPTKIKIVPYAGLKHPRDEPNAAWIKPGEKFLCLDIGTVCATNSRRALYEDSYSKNTTSVNLDPRQAHITGNMLRVKVNPLQWEYFDINAPDAQVAGNVMSSAQASVPLSSAQASVPMPVKENRETRPNFGESMFTRPPPMKKVKKTASGAGGD